MHWHGVIWSLLAHTRGAAPAAAASAAATASVGAAIASGDGFAIGQLRQLARQDEGVSRFLPRALSAALWAEWQRVLQNGDRAGQLAFFRSVAQLGVDRQEVAAACRKLLARIDGAQSDGGSGTATGNGNGNGAPTAALRSTAVAARDVSLLRKVHELSTPLFTRWFLELASQPNGMKQLIDMRAHMLALEASEATGAAKAQSDGNAVAVAAESAAESLRAVREVLAELTSCLSDWCATAWLAVAELRWDATPPSVFDRVVRHEAVHPLASLDAARWRVAPTPHRHMFGFFHPVVAAEPLVMIQVALTHGIPSNVDAILRNEETVDGNAARDTAVFYSINSTQDGLKGIDLGKALIQSAVAELQKMHGPRLTAFTTLSPIPGYGAWLASLAARGDDVAAWHPATADADKKAILAVAAMSGARNGSVARAVAAPTAVAALHAVMKDAVWFRDPAVAEALRGPLLRSVGHYLSATRRRGKIFDPVGNFHVKNGATLFRLNWLANCTPRASAQSGCVMVNYLYELPKLDDNMRGYELRNTVALGEPFAALFPA